MNKQPFRLPYKISAILDVNIYKGNFNPISPGNKGLNCHPSVFTLPLDTDTETFSSTGIHSQHMSRNTEEALQLRLYDLICTLYQFDM